jgi:ATP-dependent exoDNAse (exonuclease V) beta subunit
MSNMSNNKDLAYKNPHPRDKLIVFDEPSHTYTINGEDGYTSATTFVHSNFPAFDEDLIIKRMMKSKNWEKNKYYPMTVEQIKEAWEINRDEAAKAGTIMHEMIEDYYNGKYTLQTLPADSIEMNYFKEFRNDYEIACNLTPFRTEWRVFHEELKIAGTIDMVFKNEDNTLSIVDWKRCRQMKHMINTNWPQPRSLNPKLQRLFDTNYYHYTLQLNLYKHILETKYNVKVKELILVNLHPNNECKSYEFYEVIVLSNEEIKGLYEWSGVGKPSHTRLAEEVKLKTVPHAVNSGK